jgi:hypothetical protein
VRRENITGKRRKETKKRDIKTGKFIQSYPLNIYCYRSVTKNRIRALDKNKDGNQKEIDLDTNEAKR